MADMWGYAWQGKAYEGSFPCDAIEWVGRLYGGGNIVDDKGQHPPSTTRKPPRALTEARPPW